MTDWQSATKRKPAGELVEALLHHGDAETVRAWRGTDGQWHLLTDTGEVPCVQPWRWRPLDLRASAVTLDELLS